MFFYRLEGEEEGRAGQSENILCIIVLTPASPPPRAGPPSGRGSTPSHSGAAAHCA